MRKGFLSILLDIITKPKYNRSVFIGRSLAMLKTKGIHHLSSTVGHAQRNVDFYASVLGLRLVKQTLNYDDKDTYHLYYGNHEASTNLITTFPWVDGRPGEIKGGQVTVASYAIKPDTMNFWRDRLHQFGIKTYEFTAFNKKRLGFNDPDGLELELLEVAGAPENSWTYNGINQQQTIAGIDRAILTSTDPQETLKVLTEVLGYELKDEDEESYLLKIHDHLGGHLELSKHATQRGKMGVGVVHHIAFIVDDEDIEGWRAQLKQAGLSPTEIKNRKYFKSIYFREKGGILIELATQGPGMGVDEPLENLGKQLIIPDHYKDEAQDIVDELMPITVREVSKLEGYGYRNRTEYESLKRKDEIKAKIRELKKKETLTLEDQKQIDQLKKQYLKQGANHE